MIKTVVITRNAEKDLSGIPAHLRKKFRTWVESVELEGLEVVMRIPGYHDHPLKGVRQGQRAIKLNDQYRAVYLVKEFEIEFVEVQEVNKHDY